MVAIRKIQTDIVDRFELTELKTFRNADGLIYAIVAHNKQMGLVSDSWFGAYGPIGNFKAVLETMAAAIEHDGYTLWLADLRYLSQSFFEAEAYLTDDVVPRILAGGLQREAVVTAELDSLPEGYDVFGSANQALQRIADGRIRGFTDIGIARRWLLAGELPG
ncbi:MAG: hypothetical protein ACMVY4_01045 [Minwuia sp.]|uniref:hypothetical protein n=1 Tax=Minwuia sp. TaxID=2493630 RepID=UPI003A8AEEFA